MRSLAYCGDGSAVAYGLAGPGGRYCDNVGRPHRSNGAYYLLDFASGQFCQKCYDPDCAGYRSAYAPLPPGVWQRERVEGDLAAAAAAAPGGGNGAGG